MSLKTVSMTVFIELNEEFIQGVKIRCDVEISWEVKKGGSRILPIGDLGSEIECYPLSGCSPHNSKRGLSKRIIQNR